MKVRTKAGHIFRPIKTYPYKSLRLSIEQLVKKNPSFFDDCEKWRHRTVPDGYICDIYVSLFWKTDHVVTFSISRNTDFKY